MAGFNRRKFLLATGGAGVAVALLQLDAPAALAADPALAPEHTATLAAVLSALAAGPAAGLRPEDVTAYLAAFDEHLATAGEPLRRYAGETLDRVAASGLPALAPAAALERLRAWSAGEAPVLAAAALQLAGLTLDPDEDVNGRAPGYALSAH